MFEKRAMWNDGGSFEDHLGSAEAPAIARRHLCYFGKSSGGGGNSGTQTVVNQTKLPQWVEDAGRENYDQAKSVAANLKGPYQGQRVADMTTGQTSNIAALQGGIGATDPAFANAQGTAANLQNYNPNQVSPNFLSGTDMSKYMNPYTDNVIKSGMQALDMQRQAANNQGADQAIRADAFGGSRQGVAEGVTNAMSAMQAGQLASGLQAQNFSQAQNAATTDLNRDLQAQTQNQQAGLSGAGLNLGAAGLQGQLAGQGQQARLQSLMAAMQGQQMQQGQTQAGLDAARQKYTEEQQFPLQQLQIPMQALGMTPYGQTQTQTTTGLPGMSSNGLMQGLGAAGAGVGMMGSLFGQGSLFGGSEGIFGSGGIMNMFS